MIVYDMSAENKLQELKIDYWRLIPKIEMAAESYVRDARKIVRSKLLRRYPIAPRHLTFKSQNNNHWTLALSIQCNMVASLTYITIPGVKNTYISFYSNARNRHTAREFTHHFIQRYKERLLIPNGLDLSGGNVIEDYIWRTGNAVEYDVDENLTYSVSKHGFAIIHPLIPHYFLMKTYIAKDETFSKNKADFSDQVASVLNLYLFLSENRFQLTYEIVEEQFRKCEHIDETFMEAYAKKFRPNRPVNYDDINAFCREEFGRT